MKKQKGMIIIMNNKAIYKLTYGLFVLSAFAKEKHNGCIINTAAQVTSSPNRISIAVNKANFTHDMIVESGLFNISIISEEAKFSLFERFGFQSGRDVDKFDGMTEIEKAANGIYYVTAGTNAYLSAKVEKTVDLGTHTLFIAEVTDMDVLSEVPSATYNFYQENIKPKLKAETKEINGKTIWRCTVCGYEYEGEELPEDFICPWCKHPASDFEKIIK